MSHKENRIHSLNGVNITSLNLEELKKIANDFLKSKPHGICFSALDNFMGPKEIINEEQITKKINVIKPYTSRIRTFSCTKGNEIIPQIAKKNGFKTFVGAWLDNDLEKNELEIEGLIKLCNEGLVDIASVGNEVMYREELSEDILINYINRVKDSTKNVPVGYVDAYYEFSDRPNLTEACDIILANCYPFWEGCDINYSLVYMKQMFYHARDVGNGKRVIISETGWPSKGTSIRGAEPSFLNFLRYFINAQQWSKDENIEMYYFSSFDEEWKTDIEGDVGASWGLWDANMNLKF